MDAAVVAADALTCMCMYVRSGMCARATVYCTSLRPRVLLTQISPSFFSLFLSPRDVVFVEGIIAFFIRQP